MPVATRRRRPDDDEELDETPRRRRRLDDDEEERPRGRRRPEPDDEDEDEDDEEAPRSRRARRDAEEEDDRPRRRRDQDDEEDEDEDDAPSRRRSSRRGPVGRAGRRPAATRSSRRVATGWAGHKTAASGGGNKDDLFQLDKKPQVIKVLQDEPFAAYRQHWIPKKNRSYICLKAIDGECPLCDIGDRPNSSKTLFNVVEMSNPAKVVVWQAGAMAAGELEDASGDDRWDGLSDPKLYFEVFSKKKNDKTEHKVNTVRARDLAEDWDLGPLTKSEIAELADQFFDDEFVRIPTQDELAEVADELV